MRLQRIGKRGQAYFRIIVTEHTKKPQGEYLELLGSYDPHKKNLIAKKERIEYWMSKGVQLSPTVNNLLVNNKIIVGAKMLSWKPKSKKQEAGSKNQEREKKEAVTEILAEPEALAGTAPEEKPEPQTEATHEDNPDKS